MKRIILNSFVASFVFFVTGFLLLYVVKARQITDPGLIEESPLGGLFVNSGETLTAAKRNALVSNSGGVKMKVYTGNTASAHSTTFSHGLDRNKIVNISCMTKYSNDEQFQSLGRLLSATYNRLVYFNSTTVILQHTNDPLHQNKEYRCVLFYTN
ncbi:MAG: hypothetical protein V3575_00450 [Candidatus Absconditabacteria bacterium]